MKKNEMPKIYSEYLLSNILLTILIVGLLAGIILPKFSEQERKEQIRLAQETLNEQKNWMNERILDSEKLWYALKQDPQFMDICRLKTPYSVEDTEKIRLFVNDFTKYRILQDDLDSITVFLGRTQLFLDTGNAGMEPEIFYNSRFDQAQQSYDDWKKEVLQNESRLSVKEKPDGKEKSYVLYNLSNQLLFDNPLLLIVTFSENPFIKILKHSQFFRESDLIVIENKDEVLYSTLSETQLAEQLCGRETGDTIQIDGISHIVVEEEDELVAMTYLWLIPENVIYQNAGKNVQAVLLTGIMLSAGFIMMAVYLAYHNSKPIFEFVKKISDRSEDPESSLFLDTDSIDASLQKIVCKNTILKEELSRYIQTSKIIFFTKLLNGVPMSQLEITSVNKHLGNFLNYQKYCVALLQFDLADYKNSDVFRMMVEDIIRQNAPQYCYVIQTEINRFSVIFASDKEETELIDRGLIQLMEALDRDKTAQYTCILSRYCEVQEQLCTQYQSCCQLFDMLESQGTAFAERFIHSSEVSGYGRGYYYPVFEEQSLMNCMSGHKYKDAADILNRLFAKNFNAENIGAKERQYFVENVCSTFLRTLRTGEAYGSMIERYAEDSIYLIRHMHSGDKILNQFLKVLRYMENNTQSASPNRARQICERIEGMIAERYLEPDFSIVEIAKSLQLSENYISVIFRQNIGNSIAATIEKVRMDKAGELVKETGIFIKEIAQRTGYLNLNTFYKAFKRYYGVTPSEYREMHQRGV